jgi:hypothetical protein
MGQKVYCKPDERASEKMSLPSPHDALHREMGMLLHKSRGLDSIHVRRGFISAIRRSLSLSSSRSLPPIQRRTGSATPPWFGSLSRGSKTFAISGVDPPYKHLVSRLPMQFLARYAAVTTESTGTACQQRSVHAIGPAALPSRVSYFPHYCTTKV